MPQVAVVVGRVLVSRLDLGFNFNCRFFASVFTWSALVSMIMNEFVPSYSTEILLWCCVNCYIWEGRTPTIK